MKRVISFILLAICFLQVHGHGYVSFPAARNSLWRFVTPSNHVCPAGQENCPAPPANYDDNGLNNGGAANEYSHCNGGGYLTGCPARLGFCGDNDNSNAHLDGGSYSTGAIQARYIAGQKIFTQVYINVNHGGFFEFWLVDVPDTQRHDVGGADPYSYPIYPLTMANANSAHNKCFFLAYNPTTQWCIPTADFYGPTKTYNIELNLPTGVTCTRCMLKWKYTTGNSQDSNNVEIFQNCADVGIVAQGGSGFQNTAPSGWAISTPGGETSSNPPTHAPGVTTVSNPTSSNPTISTSSSTSSTSPISTSSSSTTSTSSVSTTGVNNVGFCAGKATGDYCSPSAANAYISCPLEANRYCQPGLVCANRPEYGGVACDYPQ